MEDGALVRLSLGNGGEKRQLLAREAQHEEAEHIDQPRAVRAVAGACAANSLAVIVPCHRVVR
ncbi:hypothetical protein CQA65_30310, partial [Klebsiella pneumoniae]